MPPQTEQPQPKAEPAIQPSWTASPETPPTPAETAPTDLSHLISNNLAQEPPTQPPTQQPTAETLVVPPVQNNPEEAALSANHKGFPRWLIGLAIGLLVIVAGASAYFIMGIGQTKTTTSIPAEVAPQKAQVNVPPQIPTIPPAQPATGSANFGQLEGNGGTQPQATSSSMDLIRQRQQGQ